MLKNKNVIGVKNSSMPVQDIQMFKDRGGDKVVVFNGPDEQLAGGLLMGATGGIGGTYAAMPRLYIKLFELTLSGQVKAAYELQNDICRIIYLLVSGKGNMYAMIKELLRRKGVSCGSVRAPLLPLTAEDQKVADACEKAIKDAESKYL